ncbi:MAG: beta-ketoacyl-[acyl-carrier-protein] synthase family protein [Deltaproteobacteria bacterium]|nr:beta-ketoacyl-[acyl-carrier-protein] synthase family protein [Deltaproteobacteria bacterium]
MNRQVVVTGIGVISPLESGKGLEVFWQELVAGKNAIKEINSFDAKGYECKIAGEVEDFKDSEADRWIRFLDSAFKQAMEDANIDANAASFGLCVGTVLGGILAGQEAWKNGKQEMPETYSLFSGEHYLTNKYNIKGPVMSISTACASGTDAIGIAYRNILWGKADVMIAGGIDILSEFAFAGFNSLKALTKDRVRPFDKNRDGLAIGEGAAFLVLEEFGTAQKRGAKIYGRISGYASRADANHLTGPDKEGKGLASAMKAALNEAGISRVDYINAHGTGTAYNDAMETKAIKLAFGKSAYNIPVSSIKSMLGHSFGAAGAIEAAACLLAIRDEIIPPTINYQEKDPECDLDYVPNIARKADIKSVISLSAGFGGQNAALLFEMVS